MKPATKEAYELFHKGSLTLAQIERNGMRIDTEYLDKAILKTDRKIKKLQQELQDDKVWRKWRKRFGETSKLTSRDQLGKVVFDELGYKSIGGTRTKEYSTSEEAFEHIDLPFVKNVIRMHKLITVKSTFLGGIRRNTIDGYLYPNFNLNTAVSYRSSADHPNSQNFPIRDPDLAEMVRKAFISRFKKGHIGELDFKVLEVCISACYNGDPNLIKYVSNPKKDMHRDMAMQCFMLDKLEVTPDTRYCAKNMFVFPEFYGDYYIRCAISLWEAMERLNLKTVDGMPLREHLRRKGIKALGACDPDQQPISGTFEAHIKAVEQDFWNRRFKVYRAWKDRFYDDYQARGYFRSKTGFLYQGILRKNQVVNFPIQGSAFHCLLWTLIQLQDWMNKQHMRSVLIGQIHDSGLGDFHHSELDDCIGKAKEIVTVDLPKHWDWICVPLRIDCAVAPIGGSWYDKKEYTHEAQAA